MLNADEHTVSVRWKDGVTNEADHSLGAWLQRAHNRPADVCIIDTQNRPSP